ncbi:MAG TPA: penicillin-binding transpeptidase domain-containing protein [Candidatus Acidoferrum sp.]|nr:penicillin-binding transpeptidase domain-containing protein [Candidatus Acidoferrum sp.]
MSRTRQENIRLGLLFGIVTLTFVAFVGRLVHLQIYLNQPYSAIVNHQTSGTIPIPAERGMIYDRNGQPVAKNVIGSSLYAWPEDNEEVAKVSDYLDQFYRMPSGWARSEFKLEPKKFRWIKRRMTDPEADRVEREAPLGLHLRKESQREYPFGLVGRQILGFTDIDNQGQSGFELAYDSILSGQPGSADIRRDGLRNTYRVKEEALVKPVPGRPLVLTIDWRLQDIVEQELHHAVDTFHAAAGLAVYLDCRNGDILAMAHYDPLEKNPDRPTKLRAISDQFEPGSVFKPFTAAGVIEAGLADYKRQVYCENGAWNMGSHVLHDDKKHGWLTFREIIELSSNIGIAKWAIQADGNDLFDMYRRFGFGRRLHCGLPGEAAGRLIPPPKWSNYNVAAFAMGHSIALTPLQLANAFAAIANGGELTRPRLVLGHVDDNGFVINDNPREVLNTIMHNGTLDSIKAFLRGVVENGTAKPVNSELVGIAGKTGTAELPDLENGGYFKHKFVASFAGYFPYTAPVVAGVIMLVDPQPIHYGGYTSGPTFRRIAERYALLNPEEFTLPGKAIAKKTEGLDSTLRVPNLIGRDIGQAVKLAEVCGLNVRSTTAEGAVAWQFPPPNRVVFKGEEIIVQACAVGDSTTRMPDMTGLPVRNVSAFMSHAGINFIIKGSGRVVSQSIPPGEIVSRDSTCQIECQPI